MNENLTPRQEERRKRAEARRRREQRARIALAVGIVLVIGLCIAIPSLLKRGAKDPQLSDNINKIPEVVQTAPDTTPAETEPEVTEPEATQPAETLPEAVVAVNGTEPDETEPEATEPDVTEPDAPPAAQVTQPDYSDEFFFPDSNVRLLSYDEYADLSNWHLVLARNEIFARHGRRFDNGDIQAYFESCSWYDGRYSPSEFDYSVLNDIERANVTALKNLYDARQ